MSTTSGFSNHILAITTNLMTDY